VATTSTKDAQVAATTNIQPQTTPESTSTMMVLPPTEDVDVVLLVGSTNFENNATADNKNVQVVAASIAVQPQTLESTTAKSETIPPTEDVEVAVLVGSENTSENDITNDTTTIR
jgi:fructose-specific component phosphotransferase system IIB-like protein